MKSFKLQSFAVFTVFIAFVAHQVYTFTIEEQLLQDNDDYNAEKTIRKRELTQEEEVLADQARAEIAQTIQHNLVRIFAVIVSQQEEGPFLRQDDEEEVDVITPNPNVLPQVAQILGAIFSGNLNITRIVDNTVGLVPNLVRTQLQGLVKLLTGENVNLSGTSTATPPKNVENTNTEIEIAEVEEITTLAPTEILSGGGVESSSEVSSAATNFPTTTGKNRYRVRNRTRRVSSTPRTQISLGDDEIERVERELIAAGHLMEPYEQNKEPRFYAGMFTNVMQQVNMTEVAKAVPSIFKGATQAFVLLENLGVLDSLPGGDSVGDVLGDLDVDLGLDE